MEHLWGRFDPQENHLIFVIGEQPASSPSVSVMEEPTGKS
jgi:hypothetical protein